MQRIAELERLKALVDSPAFTMEALGVQLRELVESMDNTKAELQLRLASSQNRLLRAEVAFVMASAWIAAGCLVAGALGMNLHSGLEWPSAGPFDHLHKDVRPAYDGPSWVALEVIWGTTLGAPPRTPRASRAGARCGAARAAASPRGRRQGPSSAPSPWPGRSTRLASSYGSREITYVY